MKYYTISLFLIAISLNVFANEADIEVSFATRISVGAEQCSILRNNYKNKSDATPAEKLENTVQTSLISAGCAILENTHIYLTQKEAKTDMAEVCKTSREQLELAKARKDSSNLAIKDENKKTAIETNFKWAFFQYSQICVIKNVPNFATTDSVIKLNIQKLNF